LRAAWRVMVAGVLDPGKLVFVDECATHTSLAPVYGYSPKGEPLKLSVARNGGKNTTLLASITLEGMGPSLAVEGSTTKEVFEAYLEQVLLPEVHEGQVLIMDKLAAHKPNRMRELIEEILRRACARTRETLLEALGEALSAISIRDAQGFFEHAGYHPTGQLL
jgi:hypothetical protein